MKIKQIFMLSGVLLATLGAAEANEKISMRLSVKNKTGGNLKGFPIVLSAPDVVEASVEANSAELLSPDGKHLPCQIDDLNGNGQFDSADEISMLLDLNPGDNVFTLQFSKKTMDADTPELDVEGKFLCVSNGLVKVAAHKTKFHTRKLEMRMGNAWISLTGIGTYHSDLKLDNQWREWKWGASKLKLISTGPTRRILREEIARTNSENGKKVNLIHDWSVFTGRTEILSVIRIVNTTENQVTQVTRMVNGFYDITPSGKALPNQDAFAGLNKKNKLVSELLKNQRYYVKKPKFTAPCWFDAFLPEKAGLPSGIGSIPLLNSGLFDILVGYIEKKGRKRLRMTESYEPRNAVLWPGKSYICPQWYVPHKGDFKATRRFRNALINIKTKVQKAEQPGFRSTIKQNKQEQ